MLKASKHENHTTQRTNTNMLLKAYFCFHSSMSSFIKRAFTSANSLVFIGVKLGLGGCFSKGIFVDAPVSYTYVLRA